MKIHFIGICGVAMGSLALAMKKSGHEVTGSDKGFFPPISTYLKKNNINYYPGWHVEKMTKNGNPDLVVVGNVAGSQNPEWIYVQEKKLDYVSYPELIERFFLKENNIVCSGTYGKTSTSALLSFIFKENNFKPNYMFGGLSQNKNFLSAELNNSKYCILEGDEYKSARWDEKAKFFHYAPTHLLLTALKWDHADIYKTENDYFLAFQKLLNNLKKDSQLVISENIKSAPSNSAGKQGRSDSVGNNKKINLPDVSIKTYGKNSDSDYYYSDLEQTKKGIKFIINFDNKEIKISSPMLGEYMAENITACFAMAHDFGIEAKKIKKSIKKFKGLKRRMEKRYDKKITIIDDIAHSPAKADSVLENLKKIYTGKIYAIFEPNTGNRKTSAINSYKDSFKSADEIIIPRLTNIKMDPNDSDITFDGEKLAEVIKKENKNCQYIDDDEKLIDYLTKKINKKDVIVFLGSHGFRGMIEELIKKIK